MLSHVSEGLRPMMGERHPRFELAQADAFEPPLVIRERDERALYDIAFGAIQNSPRIARGLLAEVRRAEVRPDNEVPPHFIGLGSIAVCFESDGVRSRYHWPELVEPVHSDPEISRVSVLSELGVALIGVAAGQPIVWRDHKGRLRRYFVLEVETPEPRPSVGEEQGA